jgi:RNA polymerase sigma factor (TIGR02999 family)
MADVTLILDRINRGDSRAMDELMPLVYQELRRKAAWYMAKERAGHTLQTTALVHEAFTRMVGNVGAIPWESSRHFYNVAAEVMRQLLVDHARRRSAEKRGGKLQRVDLEKVDVPFSVDDTDWLGLDQALEALKKEDQRRYQVVMLRYFAGLPEAQIARHLDVSEKTVQRDWKVARMFLLAQLEGDSPDQPERPAP